MINEINGTHLNCREPCHNGGGAEPVGDHREVGEGPLNVGVEDGLWPGVTQRTAILVQEVHQLLGDCPGGQHQVLPPVLLHRVLGGPGHVLRYRSRWKLCLTDITKVPGEVNSLS